MLRRIPGFRSGKRWKQIIASIVYGFIGLSILSAVVNPRTSERTAATASPTVVPVAAQALPTPTTAPAKPTAVPPTPTAAPKPTAVPPTATVPPPTVAPSKPTAEPSAIQVDGFVDPAEFPADSAERALARFLVGWRDQDFEAMAAATHPSWRDRQADAAALLEAQHDFKSLRAAEITNINASASAATDITFLVRYEAIGREHVKQITARVIRENGSGQPVARTAAGTWGVNPISTLRENDP